MRRRILCCANRARLDRIEFLRAADATHAATAASEDARHRWIDASQAYLDAEGTDAEAAAETAVRLAELRFRINQEFSRTASLAFAAVQARVPPPAPAAPSPLLALCADRDAQRRRLRGA